MKLPIMLKRLFCFKKPRILQLSYLPVLVKEKPLLFVAWETANAWSVKFIPLKCRQDASKHAAIISVPHHQREVTLKVANYWRSTTIYLSLYPVQLDESATMQLIDGFRPLNKIEVNTPLVAHTKNRISIKHPNLKQLNSSIKKIDRFQVTIQPIHYQ